MGRPKDNFAFATIGDVLAHHYEAGTIKPSQVAVLTQCSPETVRKWTVPADDLRCVNEPCLRSYARLVEVLPDAVVHDLIAWLGAVTRKQITFNPKGSEMELDLDQDGRVTVWDALQAARKRKDAADLALSELLDHLRGEELPDTVRTSIVALIGQSMVEGQRMIQILTEIGSRTRGIRAAG